MKRLVRGIVGPTGPPEGLVRRERCMVLSRILKRLKSRLDELELMQRFKSSKEDFDGGKHEERRERRHEGTGREEYSERQLERRDRQWQKRSLERIRKNIEGMQW